MGSPSPQGPSIAPEMKYCAGCVKQIPRVADFCPHCGCRQLAPPRSDSTGIFGPLGRGLGTIVGKSNNSSFLRVVFALWCFGYWTLMPVPPEVAKSLENWTRSPPDVAFVLLMAILGFVPLWWKRPPALLLVLAALCYYTWLALMIVYRGNMEECSEYIDGACLTNGNVHAGNWQAFFAFDVLGICLFGLYFTFSRHVKNVYGVNLRSLFFAAKGGT